MLVLTSRPTAGGVVLEVNGRDTDTGIGHVWSVFDLSADLEELTNAHAMSVKLLDGHSYHVVSCFDYHVGCTVTPIDGELIKPPLTSDLEQALGNLKALMSTGLIGDQEVDEDNIFA